MVAKDPPCLRAGGNQLHTYTTMKTYLNKWMALSALALTLGLCETQAQERRQGNFDPEQMRQRMTDRIREQLEITNDDEWKIIQARVEKVMAARRETSSVGSSFSFMRGMRSDRGGSPSDQNQADSNRRRDREREGRFGGEQSPEAEALQKAIESKASAEEIKSKLARLREVRKEKEANLEKAQEDLRKVLSARQEAAAVLLGLLK